MLFDACSVQVNKFNDPAGRCSVFLLSVRAGGVGLNLQAADTIIMCAHLPQSNDFLWSSL